MLHVYSIHKGNVRLFTHNKENRNTDASQTDFRSLCTKHCQYVLDEPGDWFVSNPSLYVHSKTVSHRDLRQCNGMHSQRLESFELIQSNG